MSRSHLKLGIALLICATAAAQDIKLNLTYVCNNERMYVESCNIRDLSDTATCTVAIPAAPRTTASWRIPLRLAAH